MGKGKTGMRRVRIISSVPQLSIWMDAHPRGNDPDAPLWINFQNGGHLMYRSCLTMLSKVVNRSGIKKRVYPHLFRHSRATHLSKHLTESQLKQHLGWIQASKMASIYVHLSGRDVDDALLRLQGIEVPKEKRREFESIVCKAPFSLVGKVKEEKELMVHGLNEEMVIEANLENLITAWKSTFGG